MLYTINICVLNNSEQIVAKSVSDLVSEWLYDLLNGYTCRYNSA
jgi:hypothetical protein